MSGGHEANIFTFQMSYNFLSVKSVYITLFKRFIHLFTYFWLCWVIVSDSKVYTPAVVFPLQWLLLLWGTDSRPTGFNSCDCGLSSCGSWTWLLKDVWNLPRPGIKPVSPALEGAFLTTGPAGKSHAQIFKKQINSNILLRWYSLDNEILMIVFGC